MQSRSYGNQPISHGPFLQLTVGPEKSMVTVVVFDPVPGFLRFFPVPMSVNDQQGEHDEATN